jgi:hypothetical protein
MGNSRSVSRLALCLSIVACNDKPVPTTGGLSGLLPELNSGLLPPSTYDGEATNLGTGAASTEGITGRITWTTAADGQGQLNIFPPLGGSGRTVARQWADSVLVVSMGDAGETVVWVGRVEGAQLAGAYVITGGLAAHQLGRWTLARTGGPGLTPTTPPPPGVLPPVLASVSPMVGGTEATRYTPEQMAEMQNSIASTQAFIAFLQQDSKTREQIRDEEEKQYRDKKYWDKKYWEKREDKKYWDNKYWKNKQDEQDRLNREQAQRDQAAAQARADQAAAQARADQARADQAAAQARADQARRDAEAQR